MKTICTPIYSPVDQNRIEDYLRKTNPGVDVYFHYCILSGQQPVDALALKVSDVIGKEYIDLPPISLNGKPYTIQLDSFTKNSFEQMCKRKESTDYLFSNTAPNRSAPVPLSRTCITQRIKDAAISVMGEEDAKHITLRSLQITHFLRIYQDTRDIGMITRLTGHSTAMATIKFLGLPSALEGPERDECAARNILLQNEYGKSLIQNITRYLTVAEQQLDNPENSNGFYTDLYKNLSAFEDYLESTFLTKKDF